MRELNLNEMEEVNGGFGPLGVAFSLGVYIGTQAVTGNSITLGGLAFAGATGLVGGGVLAGARALGTAVARTGATTATTAATTTTANGALTANLAAFGAGNLTGRGFATASDGNFSIRTFMGFTNGSSFGGSSSGSTIRTGTVTIVDEVEAE